MAFSNVEDFVKLQNETNYPYLTYEKFAQDKPNAIDLLMNNFEQGIDTFNLGQGQKYSVTEIV